MSEPRPKSVQEQVNDAVHATAERRSSLLPGRRRLAQEIAALVAVTLLVEWLFVPRGFGSFGVHPHPYWIPVICMAAWRGLIPGLFTVGTMVAIYAVALGFRVTQVRFSEVVTLHNFLEPVLWTIVAFVQGQAHDRWALRHRDHEEAIDQLKEHGESLTAENRVLSAANKILERSLVDQTTTFRRLVDIVQRVDDNTGDGCLALAMEIAHEHLGVERGSAFQVLPGGTLQLRRSSGWAPTERAGLAAWAESSELTRAALRTGELQNGFAPGAPVGASGPLVVAPLFDRKGALTHLITLDAIPPSRLTPTTVGTFGVIATLVQMGIRKAEANFEGAWWKLPDDVSPLAALGTPAELGCALLLEAERVGRYGGRTALIRIQARHLHAGARIARYDLEDFLERRLRRGLSEIDQLYDFGFPGSYVAILPQCEENAPARLLRHWKQELEQEREFSFGGLQFSVQWIEPKSCDAKSLLGELVRSFREANRSPLAPVDPLRLPTEVPLGRAASFLRRLSVELGLAVRHGHETHVVLLSGASDGADEGTLLAKNVRTVANDALRVTDAVFALEPNRCAVLLPCTDAEQAPRILERLAEALDRVFPTPPYGSLETEILALQSDHHALSLALADLELELPVIGEVYQALGGMA